MSDFYKKCGKNVLTAIDINLHKEHNTNQNTQGSKPTDRQDVGLFWCLGCEKVSDQRQLTLFTPGHSVQSSQVFDRFDI